MANLVSWEPFQDMITLREAMNHLFDESVVSPSERRLSTEGRAYRLLLDAYATSEEIVLVASLPGLAADDVDIMIEGDQLTIRGELQAPLENVDYLFRERPYGAFSRTLVLNVPVDTDRAEAVFENGVLTLTLPKSEATKPKTIKVKRGK